SYSATALPGLILERYSPHTLKKLFGQLDQVVVITGTNGKTTTAKMLTHLLQKNNLSYVHNPSGSNLVRGLASRLVEQTGWTGKLNTKLAIFEVEEGSFPQLTEYVKPTLVVVTNIF